MPTVKLTKSVVETLPPNTFAWDTLVSGFGVRRQTVAPFYLVRYRFNRRQRYAKIGKHGAPWTVEMARKEAKRVLGRIAGGTDPQAEREHAELVAAETFGATVNRYLPHKERELRPKSFEETTRHLRGYASPLHAMTLTKINRRTIATLLGGIETAGAVTRNRCRSSLSAFFAWCVAEGLLDTNPVQGTAKAQENGGRERVLSEAEIVTLWQNLGDGRFADVVRLLLLTGQRRNEIGKLRWDEIDLDAGTITLPGERVKNGRAHTIPLSRQALAVIQRQPRRNFTPFLFSDIEGFKNWDKARARLDARLGIAAWTLHDLRRTAATQMAELGVLPHVIEAVLNHVSGHKAGVAGIYNRARYANEMREALQKWADHIEQITAAHG